MAMNKPWVCGTLGWASRRVVLELLFPGSLGGADVFASVGTQRDIISGLLVQWQPCLCLSHALMQERSTRNGCDLKVVGV